jgi:hypothetical protein
MAACPEPSINPETRNKRNDRLGGGPGRVAGAGRVLRGLTATYMVKVTASCKIARTPASVRRQPMRGRCRLVQLGSQRQAGATRSLAADLRQVSHCLQKSARSPLVHKHKSWLPRMRLLRHRLGMKREKITPPTLEEMRKSTPWLWVHCANSRCLRTVPMALTPLIIRWGPNASSDVLRRAGRCTRCGHRWVTLQIPGWAGAHVGVAPFPVGSEMIPRVCSSLAS